MVWCGVVWCGVVWCGVVCCLVVLSCVVWCFAVLCCVALCCVVLCCVVLCCVVLCCVVLCCVVLCCVVLCCVVLRCVVICCVVLCCGVPKPLLPEGKGRDVYPQVEVNGWGRLCCARTVCKCADAGWKEREPGESGRHPLGDCPHSKSSCCTPSLSACWCTRSLCNTHAIVLPGPRRAFSKVARAWAWAYQTRMDSSMMWRMNSVPSAWGPVHSMWARCMEGVRKAAAHCSSTVGSHSWWRTGAARVPTFWSSHAVSRRQNGPHSWEWAKQARSWGAVSVCPPQRRHVVSTGETVGHDSHRTDVVHAVRRDVALLFTMEPFKEEPSSGHVVHSPPGLIAGPCRYEGPILQPVAQRRWGEPTLVPVGYGGEELERAPEEPCQVHLRRLLRRRIHADVEVRYPVRGRGSHVDG